MRRVLDGFWVVVLFLWIAWREDRQRRRERKAYWLSG
jgi:hypothetical protein